MNPVSQQDGLPPALDFRAFFEATPGACAVILADDPTFTYVGANDEYVRTSGVARENLLGHGVFEVFPDNPNDPAASGVANLRASFRRAISTRTKDRIPAQRYDVQRPFEGGGFEERHWTVVNVPLTDSNGRVAFILHSVVEDDRRRWRELLSQAPAAVAVLHGPEHRFEWVNPVAVRLLGRPNQNWLLGKPVLDALPEIASQGYIAMMDGVFQSGEPYIGREVSVRLGLDGNSRDMYINFACLATTDLKGEIDGTFVHATDVSDLVRARKQIEERERQFHTLAESIPHLAWMADGSGHIFWYNRRWYDYTGTTFEEMEGWGWQKVHAPAALPKVMEQWVEAIASGEPFEMVFPLRAADGSYREFLTRGEPIKDADGRVARWFGTNTDITEQRKTEEQLRKVNRELEEFAYVASHDLQEPLRMVNAFSQLMLKRLGPGDEVLNEYAAFVQQGVTRMEALIRDLLSFSRTIHSDESPKSTVDLGEAVSDAVAVMRNRIDECGAVVSIGALPVVRGDTRQMAQLFQNLISNSLKYRKKDVALLISISAESKDDRWIVSVRDNGIGFDQQYAELIFGLFKRLHKDEYPGTGLGLAICRRILERYKGRIWAEGKYGQGAVFYLSLPGVDSF